MQRRCPMCGGTLDSDARFCPYDGTPVAHIGEQTGEALRGMLVDRRYELIEPLGRGGMATVYRAHSLALDEDVALKVLRAELTSDMRSIARFARESRAASRIDHPNVVRVLDFGYAAERFYFLVMELLDGEPLDFVLARGRLSLTRGVHVLAQVAAAMARAHELGVIHRDLKPANLMMGSGETPDFVKIVDFGLARAHNWEGGLSRTGQGFGTPDYMAPEQWYGEPTDGRTDIYAWGIIAFEVLSGARPFTGEMAQLMKGHLSVTPPKLSGAVPAPLAAIVARAMSKDREARPASFQEILSAIAESWKSVPPPSVRVSYGSTAAAPPLRAIDAPTDMDFTMLSSATHAPALHAEVQRLRQLRARLLSELAAMLWPTRRPAEISELERRTANAEQDIQRSASELAVAEAEIEAAEKSARAGEVDLRLALIDASLARAVLDDLPMESTHHQIPAGSQEEAERALAIHRGEERRVLTELRAKLAERLAELAVFERKIAPLYERLAELVQEAAEHRKDVRTQFEAFGRVDGAIASYQALLDRLSVRSTAFRVATSSTLPDRS